MAREALLVPGAGTEGVKTSSLLLAKKYLGKGRSISGVFIDGVSDKPHQSRATLPSEQAGQIKETITPGAIIIAQSLGALGVIRALRDPDVKANVAGAIFIAPPARRPYSDVLLHPVVLDRCDREAPIDGVLRGDVAIKTYSHPEGVLFTEEYRLEVAEHNDDFDEELHALATDGVVKVVRPSRDWNRNYDTHTYPGTIEVEATHSLAGGGAQELFAACRGMLKIVDDIVVAAHINEQLPVIT